MELYENYLTVEKDSKGQILSATCHCKEDFNFPYDVIDEIAKEHPGQRALVYRDTEGKVREFTFLDLSVYSSKMAAFLKTKGITRGSRVILLLKRRFEFWFAMLALHRLGAIAIPTSHLVTGGELEERLDTAEVEAVVCAGSADLCEMVRQAVGKSGRRVTLLRAGGQEEKGFTDIWEESLKMEELNERPKTLASEPMLYYFTSGTSGEPKAVVHTGAYPIAHIFTAKYWHGVETGGLHLTLADSGWAKSAWGKLYGQWFCRCAVMVYDYDQFYANEIAKVMELHEVTSFCAPPTVYSYLVREDLSAYNLSNLHEATAAGEALPSKLAEDFYQATGLEIRVGYGQTETALLSGTLVGQHQKSGSIGKPSPLYKLKIVNETGELVKTGESGELVITDRESCPHGGILRGYLKDPLLSKAVWEKGYYHTRDRIHEDSEGYLYFEGRTDDVIKSSGYRIGPSEVEDILLQHPAVLECAVTGYPSKQRGALVKATVRTKKGVRKDEGLIRELKEFVRARAAAYKCPRMIVFSEELPRTVTGKISRRLIREADLQGFH